MDNLTILTRLSKLIYAQLPAVWLLPFHAEYRCDMCSFETIRKNPLEIKLSYLILNFAAFDFETFSFTVPNASSPGKALSTIMEK